MCAIFLLNKAAIPDFLIKSNKEKKMCRKPTQHSVRTAARDPYHIYTHLSTEYNWSRGECTQVKILKPKIQRARRGPGRKCLRRTSASRHRHICRMTCTDNMRRVEQAIAVGTGACGWPRCINKIFIFPLSKFDFTPALMRTNRGLVFSRPDQEFHSEDFSE